MAAVLSWLVIAPAHSQSWKPEAPVRLVVGFAAGGTTDAVARALASELTKELGQQVIVDNRAGAGGAIAVAEMLRSPPDGRVLQLAGSELFLTKDGREGLVPAALVATSPLVLVSRPELTLDSLKKGSRTRLYAPGYQARLVAGQLGLPGRSYVDLSGGPRALQDALGNEVDAALLPYAAVKPEIEAGKLKVIASSKDSGFPALASSPSFEVKTPEITSNFLGVFAPPGTRPELVRSISAAVEKSLRQPQVVERLRTAGVTPKLGDAESLARLIQVQYGVTPDVCKKKETCEADKDCSRPCPTS